MADDVNDIVGWYGARVRWLVCWRAVKGEVEARMCR